MSLFAGVCLPSFGLTFDTYLYEVNGAKVTVDPAVVHETDMSLAKIKNVINGGGFLPIELGYAMAYKEPGDKGQAIKAAEAKLAQEKSYRTYYNAAIVYANKSDFQGHDAPVITKKEHAEKAISYAAKAVEIGKKTGYDKSPYMNLLIGEMYFEQAYYRKDSAKAQAALKNFQKVASLKPLIAPYNEMKELANILGDKQLAKKYAALDKEYTQIRNNKAVQAVQQRYEAKKRELKAGLFKLFSRKK